MDLDFSHLLPFTGEFFPLILSFSYCSVFGTWFWVFLLSVAVAMDEIDVETITNQAKKFCWLKGKVNLEVLPSSKESSKRLLIGKIL